MDGSYAAPADESAFRRRNDDARWHRETRECYYPGIEIYIMPDKDQLDTLVVGSSEAGKYLAWTMATAGLSFANNPSGFISAGSVCGFRRQRQVFLDDCL